MASDVGVRLGVEGEKVFKDSLKAVNSQIKALGVETTHAVEENKRAMEGTGTAWRNWRREPGGPERAWTRLEKPASPLGTS